VDEQHGARSRRVMSVSAVHPLPGGTRVAGTSYRQDAVASCRVGWTRSSADSCRPGT
jgi:hypothetical protein